MKYSYSWLKELSGTKLSPEKAAELLTMHSFEIEGLEKSGKKLEGVVVGKILEITKHPNADKLQIARVDIGGEKLQIVCGAPNIAIGQKVPVAIIGTVLPGNFEIKEAEIRGEKSFGMLCAADELGLGDDHSGIIILEKSARIGEPAIEYLEKNNDSIVEIKVLPDRAHDILSHVGVAREIAVLERREFDYAFSELKLPRVETRHASSLRVEITDKDLCQRYIGAVLKNIEIKDSPKWLQDRLKSCGLRPINNVVDATNYVMLEIGQPLHAFDFKNIKELSSGQAHIVVRRATKEEELVLLDDSKIKLNESNLLITNGKTPLALAGIMGGKDSGISPDTKTIIIEAASFNAVNIRKTRTAMNLRTDSSDRFEKELDPNLTEKAMVRIVEILEHTANGVLEGVVDVYPKPTKSWKIKLDLNYVDQLLGEAVPEKEAVKILNLLGIKTKKGKLLECEIPTQRIDLKTQEDLIEDIGRIRGYEKIIERPMIEAVLPAKINRQAFFERKMQDVLTGLGFDEVYNYSFYGLSDLEKTGLDAKNHLQLANPMNPDQEFVRTTLAPNVLGNVKENLKNFSEFGIFEIGRSYLLKNEKVSEERGLILAKVLANDKNSQTFFALKGTAEDLFEALGIKNLEFIEVEKTGTFVQPGRVAKIMAGKNTLGFLGEVSSQVLAKYKIAKRVAIAELDLKQLCSVSESILEYQPINRFPSVLRDISMLVPQNVKYSEISSLIKKIGGVLVLKVELFDIFQKENATSLALHIEFGANDRTLESTEIDKIMEKIISSLEKDLKVEVRK